MKDYRRLLQKINKPLSLVGRLVVFPLILFLIFFFVFRIHSSLGKELTRYDLSSFSETAPIAPYPVLQNRYAPGLSAQSAIIMDDESKVIIFEKNSSVRFSMASTTKIMTALVALETYALTDSLFVYDDTVGGSTIGLAKGEQYSLESLLYAMLLPSANDAAETIASNYPGGRNAFIARMNEKAEELLLTDTVYDDPAGLEDDGNYTTASDLASLASYAIQDKTIAEIAGTRTKIITDTTGSRVLPLENLNILLGVNGVVGVKTGYTLGAGGVLMTARESDGHTQILVVMKSEDRFADTLALLSLITENLAYIDPVNAPVTFKNGGLTSR
jgi:serine-type D-Ala-D-Ala carboxypeptidase (penicillin-binding protein 5/6)